VGRLLDPDDAVAGAATLELYEDSVRLHARYSGSALPR
jgi:hypothetical protein